MITVKLFARLADEPVETRTNVYEPDVVVVLDPSLLKGTDYLAGMFTVGDDPQASLRRTTECLKGLVGKV